MSNLTEALTAIQEAILSAEREIATSDWHEIEMEDSIEARILISDLRSQIGVLLSDIDGKIIDVMGDQHAISIDGYEIEKKKGATRKKWRHEEIADTLTKRLIEMSISDDGEITISPSEAIQKILEYGHVDYWRAGKLAELDVNPDAYCEVEEGKTSLVIRKR